MPTDSRTWLVAAALFLATLAAYWPVQENGFLNYDDDQYVTANEHVRGGLSIAWAFSPRSLVAANWHPVTVLSHMLDVELYGLSASSHHFTSLLWHALNAVLLLLVLAAATKAFWPSAFVAALFALHPINVQSVAWIAERKNVLSTFFWLAAMAAWLGYARKPGLTRMAGVTVLLALGLMAKPMLVTLPFALLLLDVWPLRRVETVGWRRLLLEKLPLFAVVAIFSVVTVLVQARGDAMVADVPLSARLANAAIGTLRYVGKLIWPSPLSIFYPHPGRDVAVGTLVLALAVLLVVTVLVVRARQRAPYALVGWLWFLGTLVPVSGIVQVGDQAIADRYMYVPAIGMFVIVAWGVPAWCARIPARTTWLGAAALLCLVACGAVTRAELRHWRSSETVFRRALEEDAGNYLAHNNLGQVLSETGRLDEALEHLDASVEAKPGFALGQANLGTLLALRGELEQAEEHLTLAIRLPPESARSHAALGALYMQIGKLDEAVAQLERALELDPSWEPAQRNLEQLQAYFREQDAGGG